MRISDWSSDVCSSDLCDQLPLWVPVMLGGGITVWLVLPDSGRWIAALLLPAALALFGVAVGRGGREARVLTIAAVTAAIGLALKIGRASCRERVCQEV